MAQKHFYGKYEITEEQSADQYLATVKLRNAVTQIVIEDDVLAELTAQSILPQTVIHNIIKDSTQLRKPMTISKHNIDQYLD
ncbi:hypothetical protein [Latilactobacillus fuchuensis]|uniref:Uncharacterized protein n=1 Tax=Latilactobacillus fuchuensis TaxID=164393 RepID=A0A2N9DUR4_9LACO|nr:hypothetical protein [Latilactobacillus fuchuensis]SPC37942.1 conserved hypothetical protein [Latilactobacillus fuchuensis]